jgi:hypothetical protein
MTYQESLRERATNVQRAALWKIATGTAFGVTLVAVVKLGWQSLWFLFLILPIGLVLRVLGYLNLRHAERMRGRDGY